MSPDVQWVLETEDGRKEVVEWYNMVKKKNTGTLPYRTLTVDSHKFSYPNEKRGDLSLPSKRTHLLPCSADLVKFRELK